MDNSFDGDLLILCGPSGVGKSTLATALLKARKNAVLSVSHTTRKPRGNEQDGIDYHFVSHEQFQKLVEENAFAEHATVHQHAYGTSFAEIDKASKNGHSVIFDVDYQGAEQLRKHYPSATSVMIFPPSLSILRQRLENRATDDPNIIERRLLAAKYELKQWPQFTHVVINDNLDQAIQQIIAIYDASACRVSRCQKLIHNLLD